jgi:hypothetical protein
MTCMSASVFSFFTLPFLFSMLPFHLVAEFCSHTKASSLHPHWLAGTFTFETGHFTAKG